jgi:hypothetical protein
MAPWDKAPLPLLFRWAGDRKHMIRWPRVAVDLWGLVLPVTLVLSFLLLRWAWLLLFST